LKLANEQIERINSELEEKNAALIETNRALYGRSIIDGLTGLYNHLHINQMLEREIKIAKRHCHDLSVMMMDIDHFKGINDKHGHKTGDIVLAALAEIIKRDIRETDLVGRYGGEEFLIILPHTNSNSAYTIAERIRKSIEEYEFEGKDLKITISIGLTQYAGEDAASIIGKADELLYKVKRSGRNRVEVI
jgi:diguanylate cyclase (GGDEF)-like protein